MKISRGRNRINKRIVKRIFKRRKKIRLFRNSKIQMFKLVGKKVRGKVRRDRENFVNTRITVNKMIKINIIINKIRR